MRISTKGQVTIPIDIRNRLGLFPDTDVVFIVEGNNVLIQKNASASNRGAKIIKQLSGRASVNMSTDEIMKLTRS
jgi:AbrB family looped-hinge helix DNA binding protein